MRPGRNPLPASPATISSPSYRKIIIRLAVRTLGLFNLSSPWQTRQSGAKSLFGPNPSRSRYIGSKAKVDCLVCHTWIAGKSFSLVKQKISWGAPSRKAMDLIRKIASSWSDSSLLDSLHARRHVTCMGCHGEKLPAQKMIQWKTTAALPVTTPTISWRKRRPLLQFPKRNPHKAHVIGLACIKCHHAHSESRVYCLECHPAFDMKISGGRK